MRPKTAIRRLRLGKRTLDREQIEREYTEATVVFVLWSVFLIVGVAVLLWVLSPDTIRSSTSSST
jgi:trk system potassium uptake protein